LFPLTIGGVKATAMLIGLLLPPANIGPIPANVSDRTDVNINTSGWKWQVAIPNPNGQSAIGDKRGYSAGHYALDLDGRSAGWLQSVEGGHATSDLINEVSGPDNIPKKHIDRATYEDITVNCGTGMSKGMYQWISDAFNHNYTRKDGAIIQADYNYKELSRLNFYDALITEVGLPALDASSKDACKMSIKIAPEWTRAKKGDSTKSITGPYDNTKQKIWLPANFRLKIDGLEEPCKRVNKIEAITVKQSSASSLPLKIYIPSGDAAPFYQWNQDNSSVGKNGSLEYLADDGSSIFTLIFSSLGIAKLTPDNPSPGNGNVEVDLNAGGYTCDVGNNTTTETHCKCPCPDEDMVKKFKTALEDKCKGFLGDPGLEKSARGSLCAEFTLEYGLDLTKELMKAIIDGMKSGISADKLIGKAFENGVEEALKEYLKKKLKKAVKKGAQKAAGAVANAAADAMNEDCTAVYAASPQYIAGTKDQFIPYIIVVELTSSSDEECCYKATIYQTFRSNPGLTPAKYLHAIHKFNWCCKPCPTKCTPELGDWDTQIVEAGN
ncbi:MAG: phage tail protein, partial [Candidatus Kapaibacterium sp.]